jgi:hypothetical protein
LLNPTKEVWMRDLACSSGYPLAVTKQSRFGARRVRHLISSLMALFLLSVAGAPAIAGPVAAASAGTPGTLSSSAPGAEDLTTPEALAGLQMVPGASFSGVSCFSRSQCVAVGVGTGDNQGGAYVVIADGVPGSVEAVPGTDWLSSVDCVSATTCYAAGTAPYVNPAGQSTTGGAVVTISNGNSASVNGMGVPPVGLGDPGYMYLYGIGCSGTSACIVTGYTQAIGGFSATVSNGNPDENLFRTGPMTTNGVECVNGGRCMINAGVLESLGDREIEFGWDWAAKIGPKGHLSLGAAGGVLKTTLNGGACHHNDLEFCLIAGSAGNEGVVDVAVGVTSTDNATVPGTSSLSDVSCAGAFWCVATGQSTSGEGVLVPIGWTTPSTPVPVTGTLLGGVSCVSTGLCVAVGSGPANSGVVDSFRIWSGQ